MRAITMTNPTDIAGVEEYTEQFWVPGVEEHRELSVWREASGTYTYTFYIGSEQHQAGFETGQAAYEAGVTALRIVAPDAIPV